MSAELPDQKQRDEALDLSRSFIVQAPAGSGKTGLLIRRFLALLATVEHPEQILAITFTRKATAEMQERIVRALSAASDSGRAGQADADILELARQAIKRDQELGWNLTGNPGRLRIMTIDALCYDLVKYMPWSSRFGATPDLLDGNQTRLLYLEAAKQTLDLIEEGPPLADYCADLLRLARADFNLARSLLSTMLSKRIHWMGGLNLGTREQMEQMQRQVIHRHLEQISEAIPDSIRDELVSLAGFAASRLIEQDPENPLCACLEIETFPDTQFESVKQWLGIASLLLTHNGSLRMRADKRAGFPAECKKAKQRIHDLLGHIAQMDEDSRIVEALVQVRLLPSAVMSERHLQTLDSLLRIQQVAAAQLRLLFKDRNQADFIEIAHRAELALGEEDNPTDLALVLDHQLSHLLMDEVQDTSRTQIELIRKLTAGWQDGDGRTLFFVGDPMQSIYRFREADVANFWQIKEFGIGDVRPRSLVLESNFRSSPELVEWFNQTFPQVFSTARDTLGGGVDYTPASAALSKGTSSVIGIHRYADAGKSKTGNSGQREADLIGQQVDKALASSADASIGILGRNRNHLVAIAQVLRQRGISYQAVELESLHERTPILDLIALTRALGQLGDRVAWLTVLRAPWCGLDLKDLSVVAMAEPFPTILQACLADQAVAAMSAGGQRRIRRFTAAIEPMVIRHGRVSLRHNVEAAWLRLGGPACIESTDLADCEAWLDLLDTLESEHALITPEILLEATEQLWSRTDALSRVQLMTMHKSKGLEFDVVILPQLHRKGPVQSKELVRSMRFPDELLLAGLPDAEESDPLYEYLGALEEKQRENDNRRLLYVACTRARRELHLYGCLAPDSEEQVKPPVRNSLLHLLWPALGSQFINSGAIPAMPGEPVEPVEAGQSMLSLTRFRRLPEAWSVPEVPGSPDLKSTEITRDVAVGNEIEFSWAGETLRVTGIAIHHILQEIDERNWQEWKSRETGEIVDRGRTILVERGLSGTELESACENLAAAVENVKSDSRAAWIFSSDHSRIRTEWPLTGMVDDSLVRIVIDRTFVDRSGIRWIIDFKSGRREGGDITRFLEQEKQRYHSQMARYAQIMHNLEKNRIMLALYFPLLKEWRQWPA